MRKTFVVAALAATALLGAAAAPKAQAQTTAPSVQNVTPFSPPANYMSLPGFIRYRIFFDQGRWISREEAEELARQQGAPTGLGPRVQDPQ